MATGSRLRALAGPLLGLVLLLGIGYAVALISPALERLLSAANLGYVLRDGNYLVLVQNNAELRASGGFIGSFAEVEVKSGRIETIDFNTNVYKLDTLFTDQISIAPPAPLAGISGGRWAFRDSNWAADFIEAAERTLWFYERANEIAGKRVKIDGVIAVTTTVVEEIIRLTGSIAMPEYATTLTADNFAEVVQYKVGKEYFEDRANWDKDEPKTILKDIIPILKERIRTADKKKLIDLAFRMLDEKNIILFAKDPLAQRLITNRNWGGTVDRAQNNYLYVVNSNVGGLKSSRQISQSILYTLDTASRRVTLYIEREHKGSWVWPDGENKNWMRVLIPNDSRLVDAKFGVQDYLNQIEIGLEASKTALGFWMSVEPQYTQDITLIYDLPLNVPLSPLIIQRQPGAKADEVTVLVDGKERFAGQATTDLKIMLAD